MFIIIYFYSLSSQSPRSVILINVLDVNGPFSNGLFLCFGIPSLCPGVFFSGSYKHD